MKYPLRSRLYHAAYLLDEAMRYASRVMRWPTYILSQMLWHWQADTGLSARRYFRTAWRDRP